MISLFPSFLVSIQPASRAVPGLTALHGAL